MISDPPLVTVIAICYNHEPYVKECLESIHSQTYPNIQLIIMDDSSTDDSVEVILKWKNTNDPNCLFIAHKTNKGLCKTINEALEIANGKYVSIISTDDLWLDNFIEQYVGIFEAGSEKIGIVYGDSYFIDDSGNMISGRKYVKECKHESNVYKELLLGNFIMANAVLIRRSCFEKVGVYDETLYFEDYDMWLRIARIFKFAYCPITLAKYRKLNTSMSSSNQEKINISLSLIYLKQLQFSNDYLHIINNKLSIYSDILYKINHPKAHKYLWLRYKQRKWIRDLLVFVFCILGRKYCEFEAFLRYFPVR